MADDISRAVCNAYKETARSGAASAKNRADLRKAIPKDGGTELKSSVSH